MSDTTSTKPVNDLFYRPITREINDVVNVDNDDEEVVKQELQEYILTGQLEQYFEEAFNAIHATQHTETVDVGMWVSGFFGSGKSHFMKILGYLLENEAFDGTKATEIFKEHVSNEMLKGAVDQVTNTFESEVLMFQIGAKADASGEESIADIIYREFNIARGYGSIPWVAEMEQDLEERGIYEDFVETIEANTGKDWADARQDATFVRNDMVHALAEVSDEFSSEEAASRAIDDVKESHVLTPASLTDKILDYAEQKEQETGENVRYFVFIDEISQFIGGDEQLLLQLQSIVEEFGNRGNGKLFLGVTSQEQLQELVPETLESDAEETKVVDRFEHRFDLISDDLNKVVRDRILRKDGSGTEHLNRLYDEHEGILSARFKLESGRDLGTVTREDFIDCYPFLPYQLEILPEIFAGLRGEGSDDKLTGRERTLIDVTQSVLKDPDQLFGAELGSLVTLDMIFDEIRPDIPDSVVQTVDAASPADTDLELARRVLKSLYLIQQLDWVANSAENIATALQPELGSTHELETDVEDALDALVEAGYVGSSEEGYRFLRETERKLENEILSVKIRSGDIRRRAKKFLREDVHDDTDRINYGGQSFDLEVVADEETISTKGHIQLAAYSPVYQRYNDVDKRTLKTQSHNEEGTIYWIADQDDSEAIHNDIKTLLKTKQVLDSKRGEELSEEERDALTQKREEFDRLKNEISEALTDSFRQGTLIYFGDEIELDESTNSLGSIIESPATDAIDRVFPELEYGLTTAKDRHLEQIFQDLESGSTPTPFTKLGIVEDGNLNTGARVMTEVSDEIGQRQEAGRDRTGRDLIEYFSEPPFGWSRDVVRLAAAALFRNGSIVPTYKEQTFDRYQQDGAQKVFTQVSQFRDASFDEKETVDPETRTEAKKLLDQLFDEKVTATDQAIYEGIDDATQEWLDTANTILPQLNRVEFPQRDKLEEFRSHLETLDGTSTSAKTIQRFVDLGEDLAELIRVVEDIVGFHDAGHLEEYATVQQFMTEEWTELLESEEAAPDLVEIDADARAAADRVSGELDTAGILDNWGEIYPDYRTAAREYVDIYEGLYERRHETYADAVERVREYSDDTVDEEDLSRALSELQTLLGDESISLDIDDEEHINPTPSLTRLREHTQTVSSYESTARDIVDKARGKDVINEMISLQSIFGQVAVSEEEDIDPAIEELRAEIRDRLDQDGDVTIRFP